MPIRRAHPPGGPTFLENRPSRLRDHARAGAARWWSQPSSRRGEWPFRGMRTRGRRRTVSTTRIVPCRRMTADPGARLRKKSLGCSHPRLAMDRKMSHQRRTIVGGSSLLALGPICCWDCRRHWRQRLEARFPVSRVRLAGCYWPTRSRTDQRQLRPHRCRQANRYSRTLLR